MIIKIVLGWLAIGLAFLAFDLIMSEVRRLPKSERLSKKELALMVIIGPINFTLLAQAIFNPCPPEKPGP